MPNIRLACGPTALCMCVYVGNSENWIVNTTKRNYRTLNDHNTCGIGIVLGVALVLTWHGYGLVWRVFEVAC